MTMMAYLQLANLSFIKYEQMVNTLKKVMFTNNNTSIYVFVHDIQKGVVNIKCYCIFLL